MLEKFKDLDEILRIVQFQTGKSLDVLAAESKYSGGYLRAERKKNNNDNLLQAIKSKYSLEIEQFVRKYGRLYNNVKEEEIKNGAQGVNSGRQVETLNLAGLKISEADRELLGVLSSLIENGFAVQSSKLDKMKAEIIEEIQKGNATVKRKGDKG